MFSKFVTLVGHDVTSVVSKVPNKKYYLEIGLYFDLNDDVDGAVSDDGPRDGVQYQCHLILCLTKVVVARKPRGDHRGREHFALKFDMSNPWSTFAWEHSDCRLRNNWTRNLKRKRIPLSAFWF